MKQIAPFYVKQTNVEGTYARVEIEPLEAGFGHTLGNSLRRVLLTSISGYAVTDVRIEGVNHQFTTLEGMKEDAVDLILNLKQVRFRSSVEGSGRCKISVKGKQTTQVTAAQIECESGFEVVNTDLYLSTLEPSAQLNIEMIIGYGNGYSLASERQASEPEMIPVDALYSPVIKVSYHVEATRVGRRTDFDRLLLDLWLDGTVTPTEALTDAAQVLVNHFTQIVTPITSDTQTVNLAVTPQKAEVLKLTVEELDLPTRIANALRKGGYATVGELISVEMAVVAKVKNLGEKSVGIVQKALQQKGVDFTH